MLKEITDQQNCLTCVWHREQKHPTELLKVEHKCMRMPPSCIGIPTAVSGNQMQVSVQSVFPPVHQFMICGEWTNGKVICGYCQGSGKGTLVKEGSTEEVSCWSCSGRGWFDAS